MEKRIVKQKDTLRPIANISINLNLASINPEDFVNALIRNQFFLQQEHFNVLRSAVQEVLDGGPGYIGFAGSHYGNIEGINEAAGTFTYSEPHYPTLVHTGELSALIEALRSDDAQLIAIEPKTGQDDGERSEQAGASSGRRLRQLHNQVLRDGKIDHAESSALADLMEMDDDTFRQVYDSDKNGVIEGSELKAVQLCVDRWVDHFKLTPIW